MKPRKLKKIWPHDKNVMLTLSVIFDLRIQNNIICHLLWFACVFSNISEPSQVQKNLLEAKKITFNIEQFL